jgi:flagellar biosynthesis protein FlhF
MTPQVVRAGTPAETGLQVPHLVVAGNAAGAASLAAELLAIRGALEQLRSSKSADTFVRLVAARGIEGAAATTVIRAMRAMYEGDATARLRATLLKLVEIAPWPLAEKGRTLIAAVGLTGVGKTTTLAKLATRARIDTKTVTLITCDTFRVGAIDELKHYASLLDVRCEVARDASGLAASVASSKSDVILVDTPGRPFYGECAEGLLTPQRFAKLDGSSTLARQVILCLPASIRWVDAVRTAKSFAAVRPTTVAVTRADETYISSGLVHAALASKLPLSILCTGSRIPEDIEFATTSTKSLLQATARLSRLCIGDSLPHES